MNNIVILSYQPGIIGEVVRHHAVYYKNHWDFDIRFETQVAQELAEFFKNMEPARDGFWWAEQNGSFAGAIAIDGSSSEAGHARLRWFIVVEEFHGTGVGKSLLNEAMQFCKDRHFKEVYLWTFAGLKAARKLYEKHGFKLVKEVFDDSWGPVIMEQKFVQTPNL